MTTKYFTIDFNRKITEQYLKSQWRKIAVKTHPDKGGSHETYLEAQNEYDMLLTHIGSTFTAVSDSVESYGSFDEFLANVSLNVRECYEAVYNIPNLNDIEVCGQWIWVGLEREQVTERTALKEIKINNIKFRFSKNKSRWYWAGAKSYSRKPCSMDTIRDIYGSKTFKKDGLAQITA